jgi:hypothetical protein
MKNRTFKRESNPLQMELEDNVRIAKASNLPQGAENKGTHLMQQAEDCHQAH